MGGKKAAAPVAEPVKPPPIPDPNANATTGKAPDTSFGGAQQADEAEKQRKRDQTGLGTTNTRKDPASVANTQAQSLSQSAILTG